MANREKYRIPGQVYGKQRSRCCFAVCHRRIQGFFFFPFPFSTARSIAVAPAVGVPGRLHTCVTHSLED